MSRKTVEISGLNPQHTPDGVFVNSPLREYEDIPRDDSEVLPPLGLAYILSYLAQEGSYNVGHLDAEHFGVPTRRIAETINNLQPRWAGMNVLTPTFKMVLEVAAQLDPDIHLVVGGPHATALPEKTLRAVVKAHPKTVLIVGEAEHSVKLLLDGVPVDAIAGAYWIDKSGQMRKSDAKHAVIHPDMLPIIDRKFLPNDPSVDGHTGRMESRVMTARNCPFDCTFCAGARSTTKSVTKNRSPHNVVKELEGLVTDLGVEGIRFVDDLLISSERRIRAIFDAYQEKGLPVFAWDATGRANILCRMKDEAFDYMSETGMHECAIGIESGSNRLRKMINKEIEEHEIFESIKKLVEKGIKVKGYFIIGLRGETAHETQETITLAKQLVTTYPGMFRASMFVYRPYPGTQEWDSLIAAGWKEDVLLQMDSDYGNDERSKHMVVTQNQFSDLPPYTLAQMVEEFNAWQKAQLTAAKSK